MNNSKNNFFQKYLRGRFVLPLLFLLLCLPLRSEAYERIISFRPNVTEILFALGLGPKVVGVTTFCHQPPEVDKLPKIGGYFNRSVEKIISLKPDLVVLVRDATTSKIEAALTEARINILDVPAESLDDVYESIQKIATSNAIAEKGNALIQSMKSKIEEERKAIEGLPAKKALMVVQKKPLIVVGSGTFLNTLLEYAGAINIAGKSKLAYPHLSLETVLAEKPEIILDLDSDNASDNASNNYWSQFSSIPAVKNHCVFSLSPDLFTPSSRIPELLSMLIQKIHPK